jgi:hypothetical protein
MILLTAKTPGAPREIIQTRELAVGKVGLAPQRGCPAGDPALPLLALGTFKFFSRTLNLESLVNKRGQARLPDLPSQVT